MRENGYSYNYYFIFYLPDCFVYLFFGNLFHQKNRWWCQSIFCDCYFFLQLTNNGSETESESKNPNLELEYRVNYCSNEQKQNCEPSTMANQNHKRGPSEDLCATTSFTVASSVSSSSTLGRVNAGGGPLRPLLDLNLTAGEYIHVGSCQPYDMTLACYEPLDKSRVNKDWSRSKAMAAAEARQRRLQICRLKTKKSIGSSSKSRFSYR